MMNYEPTKFQIVRYAGQRNEGITADGIKVYRQEKLWIIDPDGRNGRFVACSPDDTHFVFIDPMWKKIPGRWFALCSCGSMAGLYGSNSYKEHGSPAMDSTRKGEMLLCVQFMETGEHFPVNWSERPNR